MPFVFWLVVVAAIFVVAWQVAKFAIWEWATRNAARAEVVDIGLASGVDDPEGVVRTLATVGFTPVTKVEIRAPSAPTQSLLLFHNETLGAVGRLWDGQPGPSRPGFLSLVGAGALDTSGFPINPHDPKVIAQSVPTATAVELAQHHASALELLASRGMPRRPIERSEVVDVFRSEFHREARDMMARSWMHRYRVVLDVTFPKARHRGPFATRPDADRRIAAFGALADG